MNGKATLSLIPAAALLCAPPVFAKDVDDGVCYPLFNSVSKAERRAELARAEATAMRFEGVNVQKRFAQFAIPIAGRAAHQERDFDRDALLMWRVNLGIALNSYRVSPPMNAEQRIECLREYAHYVASGRALGILDKIEERDAEQPETPDGRLRVATFTVPSAF